MSIYVLLYAILISVWVFIDCREQKWSQWWALGVFIMPLMTPYYISKTREKYWGCIVLWFLGLFVSNFIGPMMNVLNH